MKRQVSLATRAFWLAFVPMALTLVVSFLAINGAVEGRIKERLRESLRQTEAVLSGWGEEYDQRSERALSILADNPSLKASIGLLREARQVEVQRQAVETVAVQLRTLGESIDADLILLEDPLGRPIAGFVGQNLSRLDLDAIGVGAISPALLRVRGTLYEAVSVPVNLGYENLAALVIGEEFDIRVWNEFGPAALIEDGEILLTTFPEGQAQEALSQLRDLCGESTDECEVEVGGEEYLALEVRRDSLGGGVRMMSFQSVDRATREFTASVATVFPIVGACGILMILLFSAVGSRWIARPLVSLVRNLRQGADAGSFPTDLTANYQTAEVNVLAEEFSRAAGAVRESERRLDEATEEFIESMSHAQDARDPHTAGHSERVSANSVAIAQEMGLGTEEIEIIRIGARMHDLGKIGIPDAVLRKPGKLTPEEYGLIRRHPTIGKEILEKVGQFEPFLPIVELHHENPDGSGYPHGLVARDIPMGVRIVHVADVYDAITSDRAYRRAMSEQQAWDLLMSGLGTLFDPDVTDALWTVLGKGRYGVMRRAASRTHANDGAFYSIPHVGA